MSGIIKSILSLINSNFFSFFHYTNKFYGIYFHYNQFYGITENNLIIFIFIFRYRVMRLAARFPHSSASKNVEKCGPEQGQDLNMFSRGMLRL